VNIFSVRFKQSEGTHPYESKTTICYWQIKTVSIYASITANLFIKWKDKKMENFLQDYCNFIKVLIQFKEISKEIVKYKKNIFNETK